ncbi:uncharacterized protein IUM83_07753 [Phytophthora cinnamomi]|uniref:uncharacterized protein n=1 Tax=Phytophthora cinnamomi TaxID=4785 RepID=UPI00355A4EBA|nr:hypothetical protein IUM83_07753 [Phytophthora cinnamomi]
MSAAAAGVYNGAPIAALSKQQSILRLNLAGSDQITDKTAHLIATACPDLKFLSLERAVKLTDAAVSESFDFPYGPLR